MGIVSGHFVTSSWDAHEILFCTTIYERSRKSKHKPKEETEKKSGRKKLFFNYFPCLRSLPERSGVSSLMWSFETLIGLFEITSDDDMRRSDAYVSAKKVHTYISVINNLLLDFRIQQCSSYSALFSSHDLLMSNITFPLTRRLWRTGREDRECWILISRNRIKQ